jgi:hypothetical protein
MLVLNALALGSVCLSLGLQDGGISDQWGFWFIRRAFCVVGVEKGAARVVMQRMNDYI